IEGRLPIGPSPASRDAVSPSRRAIGRDLRPPAEATRRQFARVPGREAAARRAFAANDATRRGVRDADAASRSALASRDGDGTSRRAGLERSAARDAGERTRSLIGAGPRAPRSGIDRGETGRREPYVARRPAGSSDGGPSGRGSRDAL